MRKISVWLILLCTCLLLLSCNKNDPETAVQYLEALNQRDLKRAEALVCKARQDDVAMGLTTVDDPDAQSFDFSNISCASRGSGVMCRFVIKQYTADAQLTGMEQERQVVFEFKNGKICGFEEQVAQ